MGIEPIIVTKDVCGLNNAESKELLKWGMELLLKGFSFEKKNKSSLIKDIKEGFQMGTFCFYFFIVVKYITEI